MDLYSGEWFYHFFISSGLFLTIMSLCQPFIDESCSIHALFPPREWAIRIPIVLVLVALAGVGSFVSMVLIRSAEKEKAKKAAAKAK